MAPVRPYELVPGFSHRHRIADDVSVLELILLIDDILTLLRHQLAVIADNWRVEKSSKSITLTGI